MFKNTKDFFEEVATGNVPNIDIKRHIISITENHKIEFLKSLKYDLSFFMFMYKEELEGNISKEDFIEKIAYYEEKGEQIPKIRSENITRKLKKTKGLPFEDEPEFTEIVDTEKIFYPYEMFSLRQVEYYIDTLIESVEEKIYTFSEDFIEDYAINLIHYLEKFNTRAEINFIDYEYSRYKKGIESINYKNENIKVSPLDEKRFGEFEKINLFLRFEKQNNDRINLDDFRHNFSKHNLTKNLQSVLISFEKIILFLEQRKKELTNNSTVLTLENIIEIDLSDSNAVQKIIYLQELGIIDLLRKEPCFALSVNNLANVLTAITGEKRNTIQPYLNVLINNTGSENNNPYKTTSTIEKVKNQLIKLGVKPK